MDLTKIDNDFTKDEMKDLDTFVKNGCIGLSEIAGQDIRINNMFSLYMSGRTYIEISKITKTKKNIVYYMSAKFNWYSKRMEYLNSIQDAMVKKITTTRVESINFIANLIQFHHKWYGEKIDKYMETGDNLHIEDMDVKSLGQYFKSIEILEKMLNPSNVNKPGNSGTIININSAGNEINSSDIKDNTIDVEPGAAGDILKKLAKLKDIKKKEKM